MSSCAKPLEGGREKDKGKEARSWAWCPNSRTQNTKTEDQKFKNSQGKEGGKRKQGGDGRERRPFRVVGGWVPQERRLR